MFRSRMPPLWHACVWQEQSCWERPTFQSSLSRMSPTISSMDERTIPTISHAPLGAVAAGNPQSSQQGDRRWVWVLMGLVAFVYPLISAVSPVSSQRQGASLSLVFCHLVLVHPLNYATLARWPGM